MHRTLDACERSQFLGAAVWQDTVPKIAADRGDTRQPAGEIAEPDRLDEVVKAIEHRTGFGDSVRFARDGDDKKHCR